jgi:uncharacterized membrane protein (DUF2068 family)
LSSSPQHAPTLYAIVAVKVIRGILLLMLAMKVYTMVGDDMRPHFDEAVRRLKLDPETEFFDRLGDRVDSVTPVNVGWAATGALLYGLLSLAEGLGLLLRSRWAGILVVAESGFFVPLETYELIKHPSITIALVLALNVAIVLYLHRNRARLFRHA